MSRLPLWRLRRLVRWLLLPRYRYRDEVENAAMAAVLARILWEDSNCVDVGSHRGGILRECVRRAPRGRHVAVEPLPDLAARLRRRFPGVEVLEAAASDRAGEAAFHHVLEAPGLSGLRRTGYPAGAGPVEALRVRTVRLDDVLPPDLPIHLLKVDVEGAELAVLQGAERTIATWRPFILFECEPGSAAAFATEPAALHALLAGRHGLGIYRLDGTGPLSREAFVRLVEQGEAWNFLAAPAPPGLGPALVPGGPLP